MTFELVRKKCSLEFQKFEETILPLIADKSVQLPEEREFENEIT